MSKEKHYEFITKLYEFCGIDDYPSMFDLCEVEIGGVEFAINHGGEADMDGLYVYCDVGAPTEENKAVVFERLMGTNMLIFGNNMPCFGFDGLRGQVVLMRRLALSALTFDSLLSELEGLVTVINNWQHTIFRPLPGASDNPLPNVLQ